eukprot:334113_1
MKYNMARQLLVLGTVFAFIIQIQFASSAYPEYDLSSCDHSITGCSDCSRNVAELPSSSNSPSESSHPVMTVSPCGQLPPPYIGCNSTLRDEMCTDLRCDHKLGYKLAIIHSDIQPKCAKGDVWMWPGGIKPRCIKREDSQFLNDYINNFEKLQSPAFY